MATASRVRSSTSAGSRPGEEVAELVGADDEDRIVEALGAQQLDRARVRVEAHVVGGEGGARERQPVLGGRVDVAMRRDAR